MTDKLSNWKPTTRVEFDRIDPVRVTLLANILGLDKVPDDLPPLWHWLGFLPTAGRSQTGTDGHPRRGGFLPPLTEQRRMFAGGTLTFRKPVRVRQNIQRVGAVTRVTDKKGKGGPFSLVSVGYEISGQGQRLITEVQDLIYTNSRPAAVGTKSSRRGTQPWQTEVGFDEVALFQFSAVTFNGHRIHYDRRYAREIEGYPDLVVQGPLLALFLAELARKHIAAPMSDFTFRLRSPTFVNEKILLEVQPIRESEAKLFAYGPTGAIAIEATALFS